MILTNSYIYPLLAAIFPAVFLFAKNIHEVKFLQFFKLISAIIIFSCSYLFYLDSIYENAAKSAFTMFIAVLTLYNIGKIYNKLIKKKIREQLLVKFLFVSLVIFSIYFLQQKIAFSNLEYAKITPYLNGLYLFLILIPLIKIISFKSSHKILKSNNDSDKNTNSSHDNLPDIYYIIVDGYAGAKALKQVLNYDNSAFIEYLKANNFIINNDALSNYPITNLSLASSLNMDYVQNFFNYKNITSDQDGIHKLYDHHLNHKTAQDLKNKGYKYIHLVNHWEQMYFNKDENADIEIKSTASYEYYRIFLKKTLLGIFEKNIFTNSLRKNMLYLFEKLTDLPQIDAPKFVFSHLVCPHEPYLFDKFGKMPKISDKSAMDKENIPLYLDQIEFLNEKLKQIIAAIKINSKQEPIIIIHADHGPEFMLNENCPLASDGTPIWPENISKEMALEKFNIFMALSLPNFKGDLKFKTPVNIFRFIFNNYLNEKYDLLDEKQYYSTYLDHFNFRDVSDKL